MNKDEIVAAVDVGSSGVVCSVGRILPDNRINLLYAQYKSCKKGLKNGVVINILTLSNTIKELLDEVEKEAGNISIGDLYAGVRGSHINSINNKGIYTIPRSDKEITEEDVYSVIENAKAIHLPNEREIIHVIPQEFSVDKEKGFDNPVGMEGNILETSVHIITGSISHLNNISKTFANAGVNLKEHVYHLYPLAEVILSEEEKKLGTLLIDIGEMTTSIAIYSDGKIRFSKDIPTGSFYITNDIAFALHIPFDEANKIKENYGYAMSSLIEDDKEIEIVGIDRHTRKRLSQSSLVEYIKPRVEEILLEIKAIVGKTPYGEVINGIVITGGGSMLKGMDRAIEKIFNIRDVRYGFVSDDYVVINDNKYTAQKYTTAISLLCYPVFIKPQLEEFFASDLSSNGMERFFAWLKNFFS